LTRTALPRYTQTVSDTGIAQEDLRCLPRFHQVYFRTSKGGVGVEYGNARAEFAAVFAPDEVHILRDRPSRCRLSAELLVSEEDVGRRAERLGYTLGIVRVTRHPVEGRAPGGTPKMRGRWPVGWLREGDSELLFEPVWTASEEQRMAESPHVFSFPQARNGQVLASSKGHRVNRRLSPLDARFIANICGLSDGAHVLDPFAGLCVLADALARRGLRAVAADADPGLRIGLAEHHPGAAVVADARALPYGDGAFEGIVTEPPYHPTDQPAVVDSMGELARVVLPGGRLALFVADFMLPDLEPAWAALGLREVSRYAVRRHGIHSVCVVLSKGEGAHP